MRLRSIFVFLVVVSVFCHLPSAYAQNFGGRASQPSPAAESDFDRDSLRLVEEDLFFETTKDIALDTTNQPLLDYDASFHKDAFILNAGRPQTPGYRLEGLNLTDQRDYDLYPAYTDYVRANERSTPMKYSNVGILDITYVQATQEEPFLNVEFTRTFRDNNDVHLSYNNIKDIGEYDNSRARHNNIAFYWQLRNQKRGRLRLAYFGNFTEDQQNGGITTDSILDNPDFSNRLAVPVFLGANEKITHEDHHVYAEWTQEIGTSKKGDAPLLLRLRPYIKNGRQGFDNDNGFDSSFYNARFGIDTIQAHYRASSRAIGGLFGANLRTSLFHLYGNLDISREENSWFLFEDSASLQERTFTHIVLSSGLKIDLGPAQTEWYGELRNFRNNALYQLRGDAQWEVLSGLRLFGSLNIESRIPRLINTYVANELDPDNVANDIYDVQELTVGGEIQKGILRASLTSSISRANNLPFLDTSGRLRQSRESTTLSQLGLRLNLEGRIYAFENYLLLSETDSDIVRRPELALRSRLALKQRWFKNKLDVRLGIQYSLFSEYDGYYYSPWHQEFILGTETYGPLDDLDFFLNIRVSSFRFMLMFENLSQSLSGEAVQHIQGYPQRDPGIRLGVNWTFLD